MNYLPLITLALVAAGHAVAMFAAVNFLKA